MPPRADPCRVCGPGKPWASAFPTSTRPMSPGRNGREFRSCWTRIAASMRVSAPAACPAKGARCCTAWSTAASRGHKLQVSYRPTALYRCVELRHRYGTAVCQTIPADPVDGQVVAAFFAVLAPVQLDLYERVLSKQRATLARSHQPQAHHLHPLPHDPT